MQQPLPVQPISVSVSMGNTYPTYFIQTRQTGHMHVAAPAETIVNRIGK
ncbi:MAG: hypothetical protein OET45_10505 [Chromatiales bacterium]|jgi:hypothetical protein|nr:hypothetical protein [Chromatiales bacterium]